MILITGGAGFIGSILNAKLVVSGYETIIVDRLGTESKWRNIASHPPARLIRPDALENFLATDPPIQMVFHLGAISETTARDGDLVWETNVALPTRLWAWCAAQNVRLVYASSAATYGNGESGFDDDPAQLAKLRPLNLYGWSKHVFDTHVVSWLAQGKPRPPQWAGLKFFNVYGPNEYHKGKMISVVKVKFDEIAAGHPARLFKSSTPGMADGDQKRDFIWVEDTVDVMLWLLQTPSVNGLFNLGTGEARTYLDLAHAVCDAAGVERHIDFIDMPASLHGQYQSYTQATLTRLRVAGYTRDFTSLEKGVELYVKNYLKQKNPYY